MKLAFFCPLWGSEHLNFETFLHQVVTAGYDGVEMSFPLVEKERDEMTRLLKEYNLSLIAQHWETIDADLSVHCTNFERRLWNLVATRPKFINSQTGKDYFSFEQNRMLFEAAKRISNESAIPIFHETHRGKWSFAAHITEEYIKQLPDLKLTFDASHWCNTAESFLDDQPSAVHQAIAATAHIHARVGYPEGPQVPDPRVEQWRFALEKHAAWWDAILKLNEERGVASFTITPEFGAPPYMVIHPATGQPLVNQWEVNVWMMNYLKRRYCAT
jgi:sugar phosphate isomerase/epimerase